MHGFNTDVMLTYVSYATLRPAFRSHVNILSVLLQF